MRWAWPGLTLGAIVALVVFAPAAWLADMLGQATGGRLILADPRGTVWNGSGELVLTVGTGVRGASALPGRLQWTLGLDGTALGLRVRHECCINGELRLRITPGLNRVRVDLIPPGADSPPAAVSGSANSVAIGQWPAALLVGLGTPWNTLQPTGSLQLSSPGLGVELVQGRWLFNGGADLEMGNISSRLAALDVLGSYRLTLRAEQGQPLRLQLSTISGALRLQGSGEWSGLGSASRLRFNGTASAAPGTEAVLGGLLNIIGRRQGAQSLITIG